MLFVIDMQEITGGRHHADMFAYDISLLQRVNERSRTVWSIRSRMRRILWKIRHLRNLGSEISNSKKMLQSVLKTKKIELSVKCYKKNLLKEKMRMKEKIVWLYLVIVLLLANICWLIAYSNPEDDGALLFIMIASFLPMVLTLIITKITKEGWNDLGIQFGFKKGWQMYLVSIFGTLLMTYLANPFMLLLFKGQVTSSFTPAALGEVALSTLLGIACFIEMMGEELGWIGYVYPRLEKLTGSISALVLLGIIRGIYHLGILFYMDHPVVAFVEITLSNILLSPFMIYLFKRSGSVFPCTISHGIANLLPIFLIYDNDWYYSHIWPMVICMIPTLLVGAYGLLGMKKHGYL